jgi:transcriptional regulator with XRE-family HTH domain
MSTIGRKIAERRKALGLTQGELADKMGYKSKSTINKIELGINDIPQSKIVLFADALHTTPAYLMGWEEPETQGSKDDEDLQEYLEHLKNRPEMRMLFSTLKGATKEDVERAVKIIEALRGDTNG